MRDGVALPPGNKDDNLADPQGVDVIRMPSAQSTPAYGCTVSSRPLIMTQWVLCGRRCLALFGHTRDVPDA